MFECWERNVAGVVGLATAVEYLSKLGIDAVENRVMQLSSSLKAGLSELKDVRILEKSNFPSGIITFTKGRLDATNLKNELQKANINISVCKQQNAQLDLGKECTGDVNRASLHYYNTEQEIFSFLQELKKIK